MNFFKDLLKNELGLEITAESNIKDLAFGSLIKIKKLTTIELSSKIIEESNQLICKINNISDQIKQKIEDIKNKTRYLISSH